MNGGYAVIRREAAGGIVCQRSRIADTFRSRFFGLLGLPGFEIYSGTGFPVMDGLLLRPSSAVHTLGMAFAIDVLALDQHRRIVGMRLRLQPWRLAFFSVRSRQVLELPAGQIERLELVIGDRLSIVPNSKDCSSRIMPGASDC